VDIQSAWGKRRDDAGVLDDLNNRSGEVGGVVILAFRTGPGPAHLFAQCPSSFGEARRRACNCPRQPQTYPFCCFFFLYCLDMRVQSSTSRYACNEECSRAVKTSRRGSSK